MGGQVGGFHNSLSEYLITYDGVINENYFPLDLRETELINNLEISHCKVCSPITNETENFIGLFLKSKYDGTEGCREPIDICITLDISGSMSCDIIPLEGGNEQIEGPTRNDLSVKAIVSLVGQLKETDGIAINTFDENSHNIVPFKLKKDITENDINNIKKIKPMGNENIYNALNGAIIQIEKSETKNKNKRIIIITDLWAHDKDLVNFKELFKKCVNEKKIEVTLIGISQDANSHLAEIVTYERGCNYYNVTTNQDLEKYLVKDFNYLCFPHSYDLKINYASGNSNISEVIGAGDKKIYKKEFTKKDIENSFIKYKKQLRELYLCARKGKGIKIPSPALVTIANYLKYNKLTISEIGTAVPSELEFVENNNILMEGGLILLKMDNSNEFKGSDENVDYSVDFCLEYLDRNEKKHEQKYKYNIKKEEFKNDFFSSKAIEHGISLYYFTTLCRGLLNYKNAYRNYNFLDLSKNKNTNVDLKEVERLKNEKEKNKVYRNKQIVNKVKEFMKNHYQKDEKFNKHLERYIEKIDKAYDLETKERYQGD